MRLTPTNTIADADGVASAITYAWRDSANALISTTGSATAPYVDTSNRLVLHTTAGTLVNELASYTDGAGKMETVSKAWNMVVGTSGNDGALNGTASTTIE